MEAVSMVRRAVITAVVAATAAVVATATAVGMAAAVPVSAAAFRLPRKRGVAVASDTTAAVGVVTVAVAERAAVRVTTTATITAATTGEIRMSGAIAALALRCSLRELPTVDPAGGELLG